MAATPRLAASLFTALLWLAGCGGADRGGQTKRSPDSSDPAPSAATSPDSTPAAVVSHDSPAAAVVSHDSPAADAPPMPVMVGGDEDFDACGGVDEAIGPAAVHSGPGDRFAVTEHLDRGAQVYVCGGTPDEKWAAVVIIPKEGAASCGVSSPIANPRAYSGPCRSGWIREDSLRVIAG